MLLASSVLPVAALCLWLYFRDRLREPPRVVLVTFILGALTVIPVLVLETLMVKLGTAAGLAHADGMTSVLHAGFMAFAVAALVEELLKFCVLWFYSARHDAFDEPMDGIVYGMAASLGFACIENVMYVAAPALLSDRTFAASMGVAVMRAFTSIPGHAAFGVIMGACIGIGRFSPERRGRWILLGLAGAIGAHGLYNFALMSAGVLGGQQEGALALVAILGFVVAFVVGLMIAVLALARLRRDQERAIAARAAGAAVAVAVAAAPAGAEPPVIAVAPAVTRPVGAPRLPMATCILAGLAAASAVLVVVLVVIVGVRIEAAVADGMTKREASQAVIGLIAAVGGAMLLTALLSIATVVIGIVALVRERRWRAASVAGLLVGLGLTAVVAAIVAVAVASR